MKLNRRKTVLGLGAMATGSGAVFSSAAFASTVSPSADMRVVVGQEFSNNLRVEAGDIFRSNNGDFDAASGSSAVKTVHNIDSTSFFSSNELEDLEVADLPAAGANDKNNEDLSLAVATAVGETATIGDGGSNDVGFIQIENNTPDEHDIQIEFASFGEDVGSANASDKVTADQVRKIYKFYDSGGEQISRNGFGNIPNSLPVSSGSTEQIYLKVDTETGDLYDEVMSAANAEDSQFTDEQDTVDLVDSIRVGVDEE
jgi:hypothetical protein